jgi:hypothetical protein
LLGDTPRKNVERMALDWGDKARSMQHFIGQSPWKPEPVQARPGLLRRQVPRPPYPVCRP